MYAASDLLIFQNRFDAAFQRLDSLSQEFPAHGLKDDILYLRSKVHRQQRDYTTAAQLLETIIENHPDEIRADNALFELAELCETHLDDIERAKTLYETLFIDFSGSTFAVEARKRYRVLRGDDIQ
ncbi:MAG: tetratricopeptide repeat protein [Bacteroidota bacterium]